MLRLTIPLLLLAAPLAGQDAQAATKQAFDAYKAAQADYMKVARAASALVRKATGAEARAKALADYRAQVTTPRKRMTDALEAFGKAFAGSDWSHWDPTDDAELLEQGLLQTGRMSMEDDHPKTAIRALTMLAAKLPDSRSAASARRMLPNAYVAAGLLDEGIAFARKAAEKLSGGQKAMSLLTVGDLQALAGDLSAARTTYAAAADLADARAKGYCDLRIALVGNPAPDIDAKTWIGAKASPLSALRGKVVVVDFWATWCGPCRHVMPALSELYTENKDAGLVVVGVTRFYANGYLPAGKEQMFSGGKSVRGMDEDAFLAHVKAFRDNTGIAYPFAIGTQADFQSYKVRGIPTVAVIGKDGKVALIAVGSGSEPMIRAAVARELRRAKAGD